MRLSTFFKRFRRKIPREFPLRQPSLLLAWLTDYAVLAKIVWKTEIDLRDTLSDVLFTWRKSVRSLISVLLTCIFSILIHQRHWPSDFEVFHVIPLYKRRMIDPIQISTDSQFLQTLWRNSFGLRVNQQASSCVQPARTPSISAEYTNPQRYNWVTSSFSSRWWHCRCWLPRCLDYTWFFTL